MLITVNYAEFMSFLQNNSNKVVMEYTAQGTTTFLTEACAIQIKITTSVQEEIDGIRQKARTVKLF